MIIIYYTDKEGKITAWPEDASSILREAVPAGTLLREVEAEEEGRTLVNMSLRDEESGVTAWMAAGAGRQMKNPT